MFRLKAQIGFGELIKHEQRGRYIDANDTAKKKLLKRLQTYNKTPRGTVKNAYTCSKNKIRILEVNFCENKIVKIQFVFIGFSGLEE